MIDTIIFDLDDTLYDHSFSQKEGLKSLKQQYPSLFGNLDIDVMQKSFYKGLEIAHAKYLENKIDKNEKAVQKFEIFLKLVNIKSTKALIERLQEDYEQAYTKSKRATKGAEKTLKKLKQNNYKLVILSNGKQENQEKKLKTIELFDLIDTVITSEKIGVQKPNPLIFEKTLGEINKTSKQVIMIGDSLKNDIEGAISFGIDAIHYNPCTIPNTQQINFRSISNLEQLLTIFDIK